MAGLISRTTLIIKAKYSKLLSRAANPTETLDYSYEQMLEQLQNVKRGVADVVTAKKRLELQQQKLEQNVVKLETQARQAVAANREDLARQALERKAVAQQQLQSIDELTSTGALEDLTAGDQTQLDRELAQISASSQVDSELAKLKAEVGAGDGPKGEIGAGDAEPAPGPPAQQP